MWAVPLPLYQITGRDEKITWLDPVAQFQTLNQNAAAIEVDYVVPIDRALVLNAANALGFPDPAISVRRVIIQLVPPSPGATKPAVAEAGDLGTAPAVNVPRVTNFSGSIIVPAGWSVRGHTTFSGAGAGNSTSMTVIGILIPKGNIQRL